jgi:hypothetical protein
MSHPDPTSDDAWERILPQIRATRKRRAIRKVLAISTLCSICAIWLGIRLSQPADQPMPPLAIDVFPPPEVAPVTVAVLCVNQDGTARMQEVSVEELEETELKFSLEPIITFSHFDSSTRD